METYADGLQTIVRDKPSKLVYTFLDTVLSCSVINTEQYKYELKFLSVRSKVPVAQNTFPQFT